MTSTTPANEPAPPDAKIMQMVLGAWRTKVISEVTRFGVPDVVKLQGPLSAAEMTTVGGIEAAPDALERLLRAAASIGVVTEDKDGRFGPTELSEVLTSDAPKSLKKLVESMGGPWIKTLSELFEAVRTGKPQARNVFGLEWWEYLQANPKELEHFAEAMKSNSLNSMRGVLANCDFSNVGTVADVGGGFGHLAVALLEKYPDMRGVLLDSPSVVLAAKEQNPVSDPAVNARLEYLAGDMFESVPPANVYIMKHIIHDWEDEKCTQLLKNCHKSMQGNGRVVCVDAVLPPMGNSDGAPAKFLDLQMLVAITGKERTEDQWRHLYDLAGFEISSIMPLHDNFGTSIVEGVKRQ